MTADAPRLPHSDPEHPLREAADYLGRALSPAEKAAFEAHLPGCERCREAVRVGRAAFPVVERLIEQPELPPMKTGAEYFAMYEATRRRLEREGRIPKRQSRPWLWLVGGAGGLALAAAAVVLWLVGPSVPVVEPVLVARAESGQHGGEELAPKPTVGPVRKGNLVPVTAKLEGERLDVEVTRDVHDLYAAVGLEDARGGIWLAHSGEEKTQCGKDCGHFRLRVKLDRLPQGPFLLVVALGPKPMDDKDFEKRLPLGWNDEKLDVGEHAQGHVGLEP